MPTSPTSISPSRAARPRPSAALDYAKDRWASVLGDAVPEIDHDDQPEGTIYRVRVPARSVESANAMCAAIKSAGGGCYVTSATASYFALAARTTMLTPAATSIVL